MPFPYNYALIIVCAWLCFNLSFIFLLFLRENPMDEAERSRSTEGQFGAHLWQAITTDRLFRQLLLARLLTGAEAMAVPFYVVFIRHLLQLPDASVGAFTIAYAVGSIIGIVFFSAVADRSGARRVIHASAIMQFAGPALALLVAVSWSVTPLPADLAMAVFMIIMALVGALSHSMILGFVGYTLDASPERHRAMYVGVINTLGGIVSLTPVLAGGMVDALLPIVTAPSAHGAVFGVAGLCAGAGVLLSLRLTSLAAER